jgi:8-oxo-dGTP diphosphatase
MTKRIVYGVGAVLIDPKGSILLQQRSAADRFPGKWEFPGGKIEQGEIPIVAMIRELKEELGIDVKEKDLRTLAFFTHDYPEFHLVSLTFVCRNWEGEPQAIEGQQALEWVRPNDLENYDLLLKTRDAIPNLLKLI